MTALFVGQRVMTPLDAGTIIGFESFTPNGQQGPTSDTDNGNRAIVLLDKPENWILTPATPHPYMFRSDMSELKED